MNDSFPVKNYFNQNKTTFSGTQRNLKSSRNKLRTSRTQNVEKRVKKMIYVFRFTNRPQAKNLQTNRHVCITLAGTAIIIRVIMLITCDCRKHLTFASSSSQKRAPKATVACLCMKNTRVDSTIWDCHIRNRRTQVCADFNMATS